MEDTVSVISVVLVALLLLINVATWWALRQLKQATVAHTEARKKYEESMKEITAMLQDMESRKPKTDFDARGGDWL